MNLLTELTAMLAPQPVPDGAITARMLASKTGVLQHNAKRTLDALVRKGELTSRVIRTANSGGKVCEVTIYEKPTPVLSKSTTSRGACG